MERKNFSYPMSIRIAKFFCKVLMPLIILLTIIVWLANDPSEYQSKGEYLAVIAAVPLFIIIILFFLYSWSDIGISDEGLWVEFIGRDIFIPWSEVKNIQYIGRTKKYGVWLIRTGKKQLTFFHRAYSLFYALSFQPGFVLHPIINSESELISEIGKRLAK